MAQYSAVHGMASGLSMDIRTELQQVAVDRPLQHTEYA